MSTWNPNTEMSTTIPIAERPTRWFDEYGEMSREAMLLKEVLVALKRIEVLLQKPDGK